MELLGLEVKIDAAGNLRAVYSGASLEAPRLLIGSHLDTVPNAGAYDGVLGVVLGVALLEVLDGRRLPFRIEIVGFSEEEGVRFGIPFIGSRALVGDVDEALLANQDAQGVSVRQAIRNFGLDASNIPQAALKPDSLAYLEFHIEQGPVLEQMGRPLGAVEAIAGQSRLEFTFVGRANHAGTTPMHLRYDAMAGAAEWITEVERRAQNVSQLVATVGRIEATPGATNVVAGEVRLSLDVRHGEDEVRLSMVRHLAAEAENIARKRGLSVQNRTLLAQPAVKMDAVLVGQIEQAIRKTGAEPRRMVSGAGHDAMIMARKIPSAMIFLRTPGGVSHDPAEAVAVGDVAKAIACGMHLLDQLAACSEFVSGIRRA